LIGSADLNFISSLQEQAFVAQLRFAMLAAWLHKERRFSIADCFIDRGATASVAMLFARQAMRLPYNFGSLNS
jgi:hypothetical protein